MAFSTSTILLFLFISSETIRTNYAYYTFHTFPSITPSSIALLSEILKLVVAAAFLLRTDHGFAFSTCRSHIEGIKNGLANKNLDLKKTFKLEYAIPAGLYLINNLIYYTVLPLTTPSLLQVCMLTKLPTTGILHHYLIRRQNNPRAWYSLFLLCVGLVAFNIPSSRDEHIDDEGAWYLAPIAGFVIACLSALASISNETSTKTGQFWESQAYLYSWGVFFALVAWPIAPGNGRDAPPSNSPGHEFRVLTVMAIMIIVTSGTGLVVAIVLRKRDNILKLIGTAASLITIAASQFFLWPELWISTFTSCKVFGAGLVMTATWCYNHYSQQVWKEEGMKGGFVPVPGRDGLPGLETIMEEQDRGEGCSDSGQRELDVEKDKDTKDADEDESELSKWLRPDMTKVLVCGIVTIFATYEVSSRTE